MRLFIAIEVPEETKVQLKSLQKRLEQFDIKLVEDENLHICLKFIEDLPESELNTLNETITNSLATIKPFNISLKDLQTFPRLTYIRVIWAGVTEGTETIKTIANIIDESLANMNIPKESREFTPHITLGRVRSEKDKTKLIELIKSYKDKLFGTFTVNEIKLIKSELTPRGPKYTVLKTYRLNCQ